MTAYRHINLLLDMTLYLELRDLSRKLGLPYSEIVRESLRKTIACEKQGSSNGKPTDE